MSFHASGVPSRYWLILSSTEIFPSCTSNMMPAAVNCLLTEPISKAVSGDTDACNSKLAGHCSRRFNRLPVA